MAFYCGLVPDLHTHAWLSDHACDPARVVQVEVSALIRDTKPPPCQLGICFSWIPGSSALSIWIQPLSCHADDSVSQLVRGWQAICHVTGSSPSLSQCHFLFLLSFSLFLSFSLPFTWVNVWLQWHRKHGCFGCWRTHEPLIESAFSVTVRKSQVMRVFTYSTVWEQNQTVSKRCNLLIAQNPDPPTVNANAVATVHCYAVLIIIVNLPQKFKSCSYNLGG